MKTLIISGPIYPKPGNNVTLLKKLFPRLAGTTDLQLLSVLGQTQSSDLPDSLGKASLRWCLDERHDFRRRIGYPLLAKLKDPKGFSDYLTARLLLDAAKTLQKESPFDAVISTMEPFPAADAAAKLRGVKKVLYLMDPPACISKGRRTPYRDRRLKSILAEQDAILTTPFIRQALGEHGYERFDPRIISVGFPMIEHHEITKRQPDDGQIHLLFCGWLYSDIRSPKYFLDILSRLDERFTVTFMGRECEKLTERFDVQTKAKLITLPQQPYEAALQAMADADILINIGNSVPVHMPSKTLEYINTGKPFVNFYKMDDCPTLYYTKRYPLCLNLSEQDTDLEAAAQRFIDFCVQNKGKTVDRASIETEYADCTPEYIAQKIIDALGEQHE